MSPRSVGPSRRALVLLLLLAAALAVALDLLRPRSFVRGLFTSPPATREPVMPEVDDAARELRRGRPRRP